MGPLQSQVLGHVLVHDGVWHAAVEHVLEVVPVDDLEEGDVVVLGAVEGHDEEDVVVDVAEVLGVVPEVDARAEPLDGPRRQLLVLVLRCRYARNFSYLHLYCICTVPPTQTKLIDN